MRPRFLWPAAAAALTVISSSIAAQAPATFSPLDVRVPVSPRPLVAAGQTHIAYEVHITNMASRAATLDLVEVRDRSSKPDATPLLRLEGDVLDGALLRFGAQPNDGDRRLLAAGQTSVLCVWLSVGSDRVPRQLTHHVVVRLPTAAGTGTNAISVDGFDVAVVRDTPRVIGPPLEGDHWLAANGPDNSAGHRRTFLSLTGQARIAQRFAIDWVRVHDDGRTFRGDPLTNASYRAFGADVLAVADGVVVDALDEIPENVPDLVARAVPMTPRTLVGNYVLLDIGNGAWAVYAHLQLGSVRVRKGDRVRRGQVLGLVGNTGNSTEPHLHFHLSDRGQALDSEGIPYVFDRFELEAAGPDVTRAFRTVGQNLQIDAASITEWFARPSQTRKNEIPLMNALIAFPRR
ncbi:MAG TPA: M23 family metallopeptidase [Vicinamibacterales bacterium]|nr:M23 family metallopeptidase [Vicinamibacterales bacterium]